MFIAIHCEFCRSHSETGSEMLSFALESAPPQRDNEVTNVGYRIGLSKWVYMSNLNLTTSLLTTIKVVVSGDSDTPTKTRHVTSSLPVQRQEKPTNRRRLSAGSLHEHLLRFVSSGRPSLTDNLGIATHDVKSRRTCRQRHSHFNCASTYD